MDHLFLSGLGAPQILLNGRRVEIKRRKAIALLFYLAVEAQPQTREYLSGLLWPDYGQTKAFAYLRRTLWEVKNSVGDGWLDANHDWMGINNVAAGFQLDVNEFHAHINTAKKHTHGFTEPCDLCIASIKKAIHLYRGDFLTGFSLKACPHFDDWQFLQTEIFRREFKDALRTLVDSLGERGQVEEAIFYARRWLAIDNFNESVHRRLMMLLARDGQLPAALRQYEFCSDLLENELDLPPEPETVQLYDQLRKSRISIAPEKIMQGQIVAAEDADVSWLEQILSEPVQIATQSNLPVQTTPFVGRRSELNEIASLLQNPECWLLTLVGMGGIGKTRLAVQVGHEQLMSFDHGVYFVSLEGLKNLSGVVPAIIESLGLSFHPQGGSLAEQLSYFLRDKQLLLILDNFDLFTSDAVMLDQLHLEAPGIKFLVTSRTRLQLIGEWVFDLKGLAYPGAGATRLKEFLQFDAINLFIQSTRRTHNDFEIHDDQIDDVVQIAQLLDGMPLGLVMAASWVRVLSPGEIAAEIRRNLDFLKTELRDIPIRQQSIRVILDYSWTNLNAEQQLMLARLSVFRGGFTREAAVKIAGGSISDLRDFMGLSVLQRSRTDRFHLHELMRQYAGEQLRKAPMAVQSANSRHAVYFCAALQQWEKGLKGPKQVDVLPLMRDEIDNIQAAWVWVTGQRQIRQMDRALEGLCYFYLRNYRNQEGMDACRLGLDALENAKSASEKFLLAKLMAWSGIFSLNLDDHVKAGEYIDGAIALLPGLTGSERDFDTLKARLYQTKAIRENYIGNRTSAIEFYDRAWEIYYRLEDLSTFSYLMMRVIDTGGITSEKNFEFLSEAINFKKKAGDLFNTAYLSYVYSLVVAYHFGHLDQAEALSQESCAIFERLGDPLSKEMTLAAVDPILGITGQFDEQLGVRKKKLAYAQERGDQQIAGIYLAEVGETLGHLGFYIEAEGHFREALTHLKKGTAYQLALRQCGLGEILLVQGKVNEARSLFQESVQGMQIGEPWGLGRSLAGLSAAAYLAGDRDSAWELICQGLDQHLGMRTHYFAHFSAAACAYLLSQQSEELLGVEIFSLLARQKFVSRSDWFNDFYRKPIYEAAEKFTADDIRTAESRGKESDLWKTLAKISDLC